MGVSLFSYNNITACRADCQKVNVSFSTGFLISLVGDTGGRGPGVDPLDGGERLLGGLRRGETGDGRSRGGKVTFTMQKTSHSVWRDTWIAGYIDQVSNNL